MRRLLLVLTALVAAGAVVAVVAWTGTTGDDGPARDGGPVAALDLGNGLLVVPNTAAAWVQAHPDDPLADDVTERIASKAQAYWLVGGPGDSALPDAVRLAREQDRTLQLVLYDIPRRDDGISGPQGAADLAAYKRFVDEVSRELGDARAVVVVEPDALWFVDRQTPSGEARETRMAALQYAVDTLAADNPNTRAYLEAGTTSRSVTPERMAELLAEAGASGRTGFAVNVSSFAPERDITAYAREIRSYLRDDHGIDDPRWVVDTSRNGNPEWDFTWCNPADREIGLDPGPVRGDDGRDANLWVKGPATSDGDCGIGAGTVGGEFLADDAARQLR